jgi:hypothetical protein
VNVRSSAKQTSLTLTCRTKERVIGLYLRPMSTVSLIHLSATVSCMASCFFAHDLLICPYAQDHMAVLGCLLWAKTSTKSDIMKRVVGTSSEFCLCRGKRSCYTPWDTKLCVVPKQNRPQKSTVRIPATNSLDSKGHSLPCVWVAPHLLQPERRDHLARCRPYR